jgi:tetratricopeptide (TPR) repeat protein
MPVGVTLLTIASFFAYFPSISGEFVLDDDSLLTNNRLIKTSDGPYRLWCTTESQDYWPATNTSFWIEWRLWGMNPRGYHVTNLILHVAEALLIWLILRKLSIPGAFWAAAIFAVHPVNVESVAWIAQRKNTMAMLFFLMSILWYLKGERPRAIAGMWPMRSQGGPWERENSPLAHSPLSLAPSPSPLWYWLSFSAFVLSMLSKGSVAILPVLLLVIVLWLRPLTWRDLARTAPFFVIAVLLTGVNLWFQKHGTGEEFRSAGFAERLVGAGGVVWFYLYKAFLPFDLAFVYQRWHIEAGNPLWWLPFLAALAVTAIFWRFRKSWSRPLLFAWIFFCAALAPVLGFVDVGFMKFSLVADHYQHISLIGVIALAAAGWSSWHRRMEVTNRSAANAVAIGVAAVAACTLAILTWRQSGLYRNAITLYQATLKKNPDCWMAHDNLGNALSDAGRLKEAIEQYEQALRLKPNDPTTHSNMGNALVLTGRRSEAIEHCRKALRIKPEFPEAYNNLGNAMVQTGRLEEGIKNYEQALRLNSDYFKARYNLANALVQAGRNAEAIEHYEQALRLKSDFAEIHNNLGAVLEKTGQPREAIKHYQQALQIKPDFPDAHYNLGNVFEAVGEYQQASEQYKQALVLKPNDPEAHYNLGIALFEIGRPQEAVEQYQEAVRLKPDFTDAYSNLALVHAGLRQSSKAIAAGQKALELARSQQQTALAKQIEDWLNSYRAGLSDLPKTQPEGDSPGASGQ